MSTYQLLVIAHVASAALWFGAPLLSSSTCKAALPHGREAFLAAARVAMRGGALAGMGSVLALATGVSLLFTVYGGFGGAPARFHAALGLVCIAVFLGFGPLRMLTTRLARDAKSDNWTPARAAATLKRIGMFGGISHLLWFAALFLMYAR